MKRFEEMVESPIGGAAFALLVVVLMWAWCKATPDQSSAECDFAAAQMEVR